MRIRPRRRVLGEGYSVMSVHKTFLLTSQFSHNRSADGLVGSLKDVSKIRTSTSGYEPLTHISRSSEVC